MKHHKQTPETGNMKIVASIEARMTSSRLPGKVLMKLHDGKPLLQLLVERIKQSSYVDEIVVATTTNREDDPVEKLAGEMGVAVFRGSEEDVLGRVVSAVSSVSGDIIVEITGDCPLLDPEMIDYVTGKFITSYPHYHYVCNTGLGNPARHHVPVGMDVQVFLYRDLLEISEITNDPDDREHVSLFFYRTGRETYNLLNVEIPEKWKRPYPVRLTVDTDRDFRFIYHVYKHFQDTSSTMTLENILNFCDDHPEIVAINSDVQQRQPPGCG